MKQEEIMTRVKRVLWEALGVDEDEITADSKLVKDLAAESIDFSDIVLKLEREFKVSIPKCELFPSFPEGFFDDSANNEHGRLTDHGLLILKRLFPDLDFSQFVKDPQVHLINDLFTVSYLVNYIARKISVNRDVGGFGSTGLGSFGSIALG
ncbi:MAG: acyl carrier protein [Candidatus Vogelbacteria bacterium]|nr:acyl carrier protein [Candidatus Vogelbacteria bacterium]